MATKNLSRTVIEGGRDAFSKFHRHHSSVVERRRAHQFERRLCIDEELLDDGGFVLRESAHKGFDDKLGPAFRYLRSQVGRPWDKVQSELFARFDTRTTAGRHILFDHLLREVNTGDVADWRHRRFTISRHGILQYRGRKRWRWKRWQPLPEPESVVRSWLGQRRVRAHGERLYWLVLTIHGAFRQERELTAEEYVRFQALPLWFREQFAAAPPAPPARS
jgi:hypothetical protein